MCSWLNLKQLPTAQPDLLKQDRHTHEYNSFKYTKNTKKFSFHTFEK